MGEVRVQVRLRNERDIYLHELGKLPKKKIRAASVSAVADTGAVLMLLPRDIVEALGLRRLGRVTVLLAKRQTPHGFGKTARLSRSERSNVSRFCCATRMVTASEVRDPKRSPRL